MDFEFDFTKSGIFLRGEKIAAPRAAEFLFVLHYYKENGFGEVTRPQMRSHIKTLDHHRKTTSRIVGWIAENGLPGHVRYKKKTKGPWSINPASPHRVTFKLDGQDAPWVQIFEEFFKPDEVLGHAAGFGADPSPLSDAAIHIAYGDHQFGLGALNEAMDHYDKAFSEASKKDEPLMLAVAAQRLLQIYRRMEDFDEILRLRQRVDAFASEVSSPYARRFLAGAAQLYSVWHLYSKTKDYAKAGEQLEKISLRDIDVPNLRIEWANLRGLIDRRLLLNALAAKDEAEVAARFSSSLGHLKEALHESIMFNIPYHTQQVAANYANILALYRMHVPHLLAAEEEVHTETLRLLTLSNVIAELFQLGKDDMYNPIFLLSITRRFNLTHDDLERLWHAKLWPIAKAKTLGVSSLEAGLAAYGDAEFRRVGDGNRTFGPEQQALLAYEICWAAITEGNLPLFKRYVEIFAAKSWREQDILSSDTIGRAVPLRNHQLSKRNQPDWHKASHPLKELIEASK